MATHLPVPHEVRTLCEGLLGRGVSLADSTAVVPGIDAGARIALYVNDFNAPAAAAAGDLEFCAYAAAALGLVSPGGARASIEDGHLSPLLDEIIGECFNVLASIFNTETSTHLRLAQVQSSPAGLAPTIINTLASVGSRRADHLVDIAGYGAGRLSIVTF